MIITDFIITSTENIPYYEQIANDNRFHSFSIISINDADNPNCKQIKFSYDSNRIAYLMIDLFYAGKRAGIKEMKHKPYNKLDHETAY